MIKRRPRALYSIIELAEHIGQNNPAAAERFFDALEATFAQLEVSPNLGHFYESPEPRLSGVRVRAVKRFPNHLVFYRPYDQGVEILHVLHGARDIDAVWRRELEKGPL